MRSFIFHKHKNISNADEVLQHVNFWLNDAANGSYTITLERAKTPRSNPQNRLMWLWFACIANAWTEAIGTHAFTPQDVHDAYCLLFLPIDTPKGRIAGHTSTLTAQQMTDFLNNVQADALSEYGIQLPNPEEQYFYIWAKQYQ